MAERKQAKVGAVTLGEAFAEYLSARGDLRPNTVKGYQRVMGISFGDWRKRPLVEITGDLVGKRARRGPPKVGRPPTVVEINPLEPDAQPLTAVLFLPGAPGSPATLPTSAAIAT